MFTLLRQRKFGLLWLAGLISPLGDWMLMTALPIWVYQLTGSTVATSAAFIANRLPALLLSSLAGVFVDRWNRKRTMLVCNLLLAAGVLPLLLVQSPTWVWVVYVVSFVQASISQFFAPAETALLPRVVGEDNLLTANSLNALNGNLARIVGPPVGGAIVTTWGLAGVALVDAATFLGAAGCIALVTAQGRVGAVTPDTTPVEARWTWATLWREWLSGLHLVRQHCRLRILFILWALIYFGEGFFSVMFIVWITQILAGGPETLGWFLAAQAVGGIVGGLLIGYVGAAVPRARLLGVSGVAFGLLNLALFNYPLLVSGVWLGLGLMILVGIPSVAFASSHNALLIEAADDAYRGRVVGALGSTTAVLYLMGTMLAGVFGTEAGPLPLLDLQAGCIVIAGVIGLLFVRTTNAQAPTIPGEPATGATGEGMRRAGAPAGGE